MIHRLLFILVYLSSLLFFSACLKEVTLDLNSDIRLVVDGSIVLDRQNATEVREHKISLKMSAPYFSPDTLSVVSDATLSVKDGFGNTYNFIFGNDNLYHAHFTALPGTKYTLTIRLNGGDVYQAEDIMPATTANIIGLTMSKLTVNPKAGSGSTTPTEELLPVIKFRDPEDETNFYDYATFINGRPIRAQDRRYNRTPVLADVSFNGEETSRGLIYDRRLFPLDTVKVSLISLSRENYEFQNAVNRLSSSGSGNLLVDPPKPAILGNVSNMTHVDKPALGFFATVSLVSDTVIVRQ